MAHKNWSSDAVMIGASRVKKMSAGVICNILFAFTSD